MNRYYTADLIKAISIIGVVFIHGSTILGAESSISLYLSWLSRISVPCFIIVWAFFFDKSYANKNKTERTEYQIKRFIYLLRIFLIWSFIYFLIVVNWSELSIGSFFSKHFSGYAWAGQYYFVILFQLILLYPIIRWLYDKKIIRNTLLIVILVLYIFYAYWNDIIPSVIQKLGDRPFIFWLPYVFLGIALARNEVRILSLKWLFIILLIPIEFYLLKLYNLEHSAYITPTVLISTCIFCTSLLPYSVSVKNNLFSKTVSYIGSNTLTIFVANPLVLIILSKVLPHYLFNGFSFYEKITVPFLSTFIVLCLSLLIAEGVNKLKLKNVFY